MALLSITTTHPLYQQVLDLRNRVLRLPLGMTLSEADIAGEDQQSIIVYVHQNQVCGCVFLKVQEEGLMKMRQLAVEHQMQGKGIGRALVEFAESLTLQQQISTMVLHARKTALDFYLKLGYTALGNEFTEVGIPHFKMKKDLK